MSNVPIGVDLIKALYNDTGYIDQNSVDAILVKYMKRSRDEASPGDKLKNRIPTPEQVLAVRALKANNVDGLNDMEIGTKCGIRGAIGARTSEALKGKDIGGIRIPMYDANGVRIKRKRGA